MESNSGGLKYDQDKVRLDLLPYAPLSETARVLMYGVEKYGENNWRKGFNYSRLISAALRHIFAFNSGEDKDPETGLSHLAHATCCLLFLEQFNQNNGGIDDRYIEENTE